MEETTAPDLLTTEPVTIWEQGDQRLALRWMCGERVLVLTRGGVEVGAWVLPKRARN